MNTQSDLSPLRGPNNPSQTAIQREGIVPLAGYAILGALLFASFKVAQPFIGAAAWGAIIVVSTWSGFTRLEATLGWPRKYLALAATVLLVMIFVVPLVLLGASLAKHVRDVTNLAEGLLAALSDDLPGWLERIPVAGEALRERWQTATADTHALAETVRPWIGQASRWLLGQGAHLMSALLEMLLAVIISGLLYGHAETAMRWVGKTAAILGGERGTRVIEVVTRTIRGVMLGVVGTSFAQGLLMALGLGLAGVPGAAPLGFVSLLLALAQLGTSPVWIPAALWLGYHGQLASALALAAWGFALNTVDHFLKPLLISQGIGLPLVVIFMGVIGGMLAWGLLGIFLGALLLAVTYTLYRDWVEA